MADRFDWLIVGGGFRSIAAAYFLAERGAKVALVERSKSLGGFLSPFRWGHYWIDRGPQFFENFSHEDKKFLDQMIGVGVLKDIGFNYASFSFGQLTKGFSIPDLRGGGELFAMRVFREILERQVASLGEERQEASTLAEYFELESGSTLASYSKRLTKKLFRVSADDLSPSARCFLAVVGRKLLFDVNASIELKKFHLLDRVLAAPKAMLEGNAQMNLYPKGLSLEVVRQGMESRLNQLGVKIYLDKSIEYISVSDSSVLVGGEKIEASRIYFGCDIRDAERCLVGTSVLESLTSTLSQVFHLFEVPTNAVSEEYYIQDYDLDHCIGRITNFCNYIGGMTDKGVICVEQPVDRNGPQWSDPAKDQERCFREAVEVGNMRCDTFENAKSILVPATYKAQKVGFDDEQSQFIASVNERYQGRVLVPEFVLTRKEALDQINATLPFQV